MYDVASVLDGRAPFFLDVNNGQVDGFGGSQVVGELDLGLGVFSDATVEIFNGVGRAFTINRIKELLPQYYKAYPINIVSTP